MQSFTDVSPAYGLKQAQAQTLCVSGGEIAIAERQRAEKWLTKTIPNSH